MNFQLALLRPVEQAEVTQTARPRYEKRLFHPASSAAV